MGRNSGGVRETKISHRDDNGNTRSDSVEQQAVEKIRKVFNEIQTQKFSSEKPFSIGKVEDRMKRYAQEHNITLGSDEIYISPHSLAHSQRDHKIAIGKAAEKESIINFPTTRYNMQMSYDGKAFIFNDGSVKYIVKPNYRIKKTEFVKPGKWSL